MSHKMEIDRRTSEALGISIKHVRMITHEFVEQMTGLLSELECITIERLGRFHIRRSRLYYEHMLTGGDFKKGGKRGTKRVVVTSRLRVHFRMSKRARVKFQKEDTVDEMTKYGVDEDGDMTQEELEKLAAKGCPECGRALTKHGSVLLCPTHGSSPFERSKAEQ